MSAADFLFELGTEELPPRTLKTLSDALTQNIVKSIDAAGIAHGAVSSFATPRRLAVLLRACASAAPDRSVERRGPPVAAAFDTTGTPTQAATAFARNNGVDVAALERLTTDKGAWLVFRGTEAGAQFVTLIGGILGAAVAALPIAKRMRWGAQTTEFVRPVHTLVVLYGEDVVPVELLGLTSGRTCAGHRFMAPTPFALTSPGNYESLLQGAKVIADFGKRREIIRAAVLAAATDNGGTALIEAALLDEVTALVEWPVAVAGHFETRFLSLPREVVIATVQEHQRYFPVEGSDGRLNGAFVTVSNIVSRDPSKVREGNERVVRPRLSDAAFFWEQDRKLSMDQLAAKLQSVTFQTKLGSYADKTVRVTALAGLIAARIGAGADVSRAAQLAKADLMTSMVGEFPELQGTMGRYYATAAGETEAVALAIEEHYKPRFAGDSLPSSSIGQALALADKLDTIVGIFAIEQRPTGTKDPFGLRRAALGALRIVLESLLEVDLIELLDAAAAAQPVQRPGVAGEVYDFMIERLRGLLSERSDGTTVEMIDAVLTGRPRSPLDVARRLIALKEFLALPDAGVLTALNKRIVNILKKTTVADDAAVQPHLLAEPAEKMLHTTLSEVNDVIRASIAAGRYADGFRNMLGLRGPVNAFFDSIMVMDENLERRANRLALLRDVQQLLSGAADLSRLPG